MASLTEHLHGPGPKRVLTLDGGGVRGLVTLGILHHIEKRLADISPNPQAFRLSDYFDLIAGTSTGSIIATGLALGWTVERVTALYQEFCPKVFGKSQAVGARIPKFNAKPLEKALAEALGDRQLQSADLKTGLMICAKRVDTGSPWVLTNNPRSKFWGEDRPSPATRYRPNRMYELAMLVRASTAAPFYFDPVEVVINEGPPHTPFDREVGLFVDGAMGGHNNPSLQALHVALLEPYGFGWRRGAEQLHLVSVGTGWARQRHKLQEFKSHANWFKTVVALAGMIQDTSLTSIATLQALSHPRKAWPINSEVGTLKEDWLSDGPLLSFQRYDASLEREDVINALGLHNTRSKTCDKIAEGVQQLDNASDDNLRRLYALGLWAGEIGRFARFEDDFNVALDDFPVAFDPAGFQRP